MEKITSKAIRLQPAFIKEKILNNKTQIFSTEKIRNSGNWIYDYVDSFFGEDF